MTDRFLTDKAIQSLKPSADGKRYEVHDGTITNLILRVGPKSKSFYYIGRFDGPNSNTRRRLIGPYPKTSLKEARETAEQWSKMLDVGNDPKKLAAVEAKEEASRRRQTFRSVMEDYLAVLPNRKRNRHAAKDIDEIRRHILNTEKNDWLDKPIYEVTDLDIANLIEKIRMQPAPTTALHVFGHLRAFYFWVMTPKRRAIYRLTNNPIASVQPRHLELEKNQRTRHFDDLELLAYWRAADATPYPFGPFCKAILISMQRKTEVGDMEWSEIDFENKVWRIPKERYKSEEDQLVPIPEKLIAVLEECKARQTSGHGPFVFSINNGHSPYRGFGNAVPSFRKRLLQELHDLAPGRPMKHWTLHDVRRTARTRLSALGIPEVVSEMAIGHGKKGLVRVYDQYRYLSQVRAALTEWSSFLTSLTEPVRVDVSSRRDEKGARDDNS